MKLLLVDDQIIVRKGLRFMIERQNRFKAEVCEAANGADAIDFIHKTEFDILLMDVRMPRMDGIRALKKIRERNFKIPILMLSVFDDERHIQQSVDHGCNGFVIKDVESDELVNAICTLLNGGLYFNQRVSKILSGDIVPPKEFLGLEQILTRREWQVLRLIGEEMRTEEIAKELEISPRTVEGHKKNLRLKLNVRGTAGMVKVAIKYGLVK